MKKCYLASGWFTERSSQILDDLESIMDLNPNIILYSPRRDGVMLPPNQKHDSELRKSIFQENILKILESDFVLANIDSGDKYSDTGTVYEIGYAMAHGIPVIGFDMSGFIIGRYGNLLGGFETILHNFQEVTNFNYNELPEVPKGKILFVGAGNDEVDKKIVAHLSDCGFSLRWVRNDYIDCNRIPELFDDIDFMIGVIDDRNPIVSWMIGQAAARNIPIVTYSDFNYGVNVMLLCSLVTHLIGENKLVEFLQQVKRGGLDSIPPFDISTMTSM